MMGDAALPLTLALSPGGRGNGALSLPQRGLRRVALAGAAPVAGTPRRTEGSAG